ncbi:hypothetical protein MVES_002997 [Malassezia vespertilionis]|uniref:CST complex subunit STN1 n=1 Tax=Malassezia vespertilionis TaxID=2020962 RepID=A0A2N1J8Y8_9BASI|nr:hypothetical protein MVES_002997 [Malassezia vespertilionis]
MATTPLVPTLEDAYSEYQSALNPSNAVECIVRHVGELERAYPALFEQGTIRMYLHRGCYCVHVIVYGILVGMRVKEDELEYTLDDGSGVIDIQYSGAAKPVGVFSCYVPEERKNDAPQFLVGDTIRCVARVYERRHGRALKAIEMERVEDANDEPRHILVAMHMAEHMYRLQAHGEQAQDTAQNNVHTEEDDTWAAHGADALVGGHAEAQFQEEREPNDALRIELPTSPAATTHEPPSSTRAMCTFLLDYLGKKNDALLTQVRTNDPALLSPSAAPSFCAAELLQSSKVRKNAAALVASKYKAAGTHSKPRKHDLQDLVQHCLDALVRQGALARSDVSGAFQVVCAYLTAAHLAPILPTMPVSLEDMLCRARSLSPCTHIETTRNAGVP